MQRILKCPVCSSRKNFKIKFTYNKKPKLEKDYNFFKKNKYSRSYVCCEKCNHWFSDFYFDTKNFYEGSYKNKTYLNFKKTFNKIKNLNKNKSDNHLRINRIDNFIKKKFKTKPKILDIGSGLGVFPYSAWLKKYKCDCLDPDPQLKEHLEKEAKCGKVYIDNFITSNLSKKYKFITLNKVLEHVDNLNLFMKKIKKIISKKGYLYIELPDTEIAQKYGKEREEFLIEHIQAFTIKSITYLLNINNFSIHIIDRIKEPSGKYTFFIFANKI